MPVKEQTKIWIIVPAAGIGARMGSDVPKQYLALAGQTVLEQTLSVLVCAPQLAGLVVCTHRDDRFFDRLPFKHSKIIKVIGGAERSDSVLLGLKAIEAHASPKDWVLVHDAARPCLGVAQLKAFIADIIAQGSGGILAIPVADTLKLIEPTTQSVMHTHDRANLWQAQTPQMFQYAELSAALNEAAQKGRAVTDEASAMEAQGKRVRVIPGSTENIKITRPEDLRLAALILRANP